MFGKKSDNILVIKTDSLSSFVAAEPTFEAIRARHGAARISLLTTPELHRVARAAPYFDQVAALPDLRASASRVAFFKQLKSLKFTHVYDLSGNDAARKIQAGLGPFGGPKWLAAAPAGKKKAAGGGAAAGFDKSATGAGMTAPARQPDFAWALDARKDSANMKPAWFGISGAFGLLMPGGDPQKRWPAKHYGELARQMAKAGIMPVMIGPKDLHNFGDEVAEFAPEIVDLTGKTDHLQLAALAQEAAFFVSDAAEEVHLAVSVGCAGVLLKRASDAKTTPKGRHVMTLTVRDQLSEAGADFVWRSLRNMDLLPAEALRAIAPGR